MPIPAKKPDVNKWDGEDEEEEVKVSPMRSEFPSGIFCSGCYFFAVC